MVWHARFEILSKKPLIIADGGHNPEGVNSAVNSIKRYFGNEKINVVSGVMADKDCNYIASRIGSVASEVFCLTPDNPRALNSKEYSEIYKSMGIKSSYYPTVKDAVYAAITDAIENKKAVFCVGSLYMYCEIAEHVDEFLKNK